MRLVNKLKNMIPIAKGFHNKILSEVNEQYAWDHPVINIVPEHIEEFSDHLLINGFIRCESLLIGVPPVGDNTDGYNRKIPYNIMDRLLELDTGDCCVAYSHQIKPGGVMESKEQLQNAITTNLANQLSIEKEVKASGGTNAIQLEHKYTAIDLEENFATIHKRDQNMYHSLFIVSIFGTDEKQIRGIKSKITTRIRSFSILYQNPIDMQLLTYLASLGFVPVNDMDYWNTQMFSRMVAALLPLRTQNQKSDQEGLYFGDNVKTNVPVIINLKKMAAQHMMILGATGGGKSVALLTWLMRAHDILGKRVIFMTDKEDKNTDYINVARTYLNRGTNINIGTSDDMSKINLLQIFYDPDHIKSMNDAIRFYNRHKGLLIKVFDIWKKDGLSSRQESLLDACLDELYESFGIFRHDFSTWNPEKWPLPDDLRAIFKRYSDKDDPSGAALYDMTYSISGKGELSYLNNQSNIDLSADFMIINLSNVPDTFKKPMNIFVMGILGLRFRSDYKQETIIAVDEAGNIMKDPMITSYLLKLAIQSRSMGVAFWLATQQPEDLIKAGVDAEFKTNIHMKALLGNGLDSANVGYVKTFFNLSNSQSELLQSCSVGELLLFETDRMHHIKVNLVPFERAGILGDKPTEKTTTDGVSYLDLKVRNLSNKYGIYFPNWTLGEPDNILEMYGYEVRQVQEPIGRGRTKVWLDSSLINSDDRIHTQTIDHYATVLRIAGWFALNDIPVEVNNFEDVDIVAKYQDKTYAFEYERPGSHTIEQLKDKLIRAEKQYGIVFFICTGQNKELLQKTFGEATVIPRGTQLLDFLENTFTPK